MSADLKSRLVAQALSDGFVACGVTRPDAAPQTAGRLRSFLAQGRHGQMDWMEAREGWRGSPSALWPQARSVIMLAESYAPETDPMAVLDLRDRAAISVYAQGRDYHDVVKKRLKRVGRWLLEQAPGEEIKVFVDTAPVMEKPLAQAAGLGWQGKHTNLLSREFGNWVFLGAIFTTIDLPPDTAEDEHCGSCTRCLDICPTNAFPAPFQLDARRCISYLTIEHDGPVDPDLRPALGNRIYGCDDCLAVCPWNKFAVEARDLRLLGDGSLVAPPLAELAALDDAAFRARFSGSPIKRIGRGRFVRNVCYAIGNSQDPSLLPAVQALTGDGDDTVADAAAWAVGRLNGGRQECRLPARSSTGSPSGSSGSQND
ncbi:tRNA epoxyqueuosine(34) reductase QueG [Mesobaculum littorinae]|uniref:Epoxyqueuosine reductase n=1 Tax=Mesobaculum littorinae TaxID=2486419 RepID=A0A438AF82_9RHOB|nr:tRNA epoxyqueuosine(34) reductase QueG [Mesobaculum littorinae]RVV97383.1 tRNA epoxyqueuosine(34) reductase QueG [Mesobaculum littorinae]